MMSLQAVRKASVALRRLRGSYPLINFAREHNYQRGVVEVHDYDDDLTMALDLSEHMASQIFWFGYYSRDVVAAIKQRLDKGDAFIDGGANIGEITLVAAKAVGDTGRVLSFEPVETIADKLASNVGANQMAWVEVLREGLSEAPGELPIYGQTETYDDGSRHSGLGTLFPSEQRPGLIGNIPLTTIDQEVTARRLERLAGIKLDIEGAELFALRGAAATLARFKPWVIVEIGVNTCLAAGYAPGDLLDAMPGYSFHRIERGGRLIPIGKSDLREWQNVMCLPN